MRGLFGIYQEEIPLPYQLKPNWDTYNRMDDEGSLITATARDDGILVGFFNIVVAPNINCRDEILGIGASLFLLKPYRGTSTGLKMIALGEKTAEAKGVNCMMISSQTSQPIDALLQRRGYASSETIFARRT
jgi:GNAT superfamily N-acetyltransferase